MLARCKASSAPSHQLTPHPTGGFCDSHFTDVPKVAPVVEHRSEWRQSSSSDVFCLSWSQYQSERSLTKQSLTRSTESRNGPAWVSHTGGLWPSRQSSRFCPGTSKLTPAGRPSERKRELAGRKAGLVKNQADCREGGASSLT